MSQKEIFAKTMELFQQLTAHSQSCTHDNCCCRQVLENLGKKTDANFADSQSDTNQVINSGVISNY